MTEGRDIFLLISFFCCRIFIWWTWKTSNTPELTWQRSVLLILIMQTSGWVIQPCWRVEGRAARESTWSFTRILHSWSQIMAKLGHFAHYNSWSRLLSGTSPRYQKKLSGTSPSFHYWCLGLVPWIHFWYLGPDNGGHYLVPDFKNVSLVPVPDINNGNWD